MNIFISHTSEKPMYEQIEDGIKKAIFEGELNDGEVLPSVRQLAKDLNVSAITTKRAYIDLEHEGLVYTISGKGTFVKIDKLEQLHQNRKDELLESFDKLLTECKKVKIEKYELINRIEEEFREDEENE